MHALISEFVPLHELLQFILFCQGYWSNVIKYDLKKKLQEYTLNMELMKSTSESHSLRL